MQKWPFQTYTTLQPLLLEEDIEESIPSVATEPPDQPRFPRCLYLLKFVSARSGVTMQIARLFTILMLFVFWLTPVQPQSEKLTVTGKLVRVPAASAETSGWAIQLAPPRKIQGKQLTSIEVQSANLKELEALVNQTVKATGTVTHAEGPDTGPRLVLTISSIEKT
ncbi:MAG TPA: hypothetical protein VMH20_03305 [Verrucomicrobiae bacterium]|nr:hypothetical protein [Verrucomicrobiae bacterium]